MPSITLSVGVVAERRAVDNPWIDHVWRPAAVLPAAPAAEPWTRLGAPGAVELWYAGPGDILLHSGETSHYRDNLAAETPAVWVALRPDGMGGLTVAGVTVDPYEGEAFAEVVDDRVEAVPMPAEIAAATAEFIETHHVETAFFKRKRDRRDPNDIANLGVGHPALAARRRNEDAP